MSRDNLKSGTWYHLYYPKQSIPKLAYYYFCVDHRCHGFAFNYINGGGFHSLASLSPDITIVPVHIVEDIQYSDLGIECSA